MPIESVWISALDKRASLVERVEGEVNKYLGLPLNKFWSGSGDDPSIPYDRIDLPAGPELFKHCAYGAGEGRRNHANAFLSHREMFKKILSTDVNNALILEEDIYWIEDRWNTIFPSKLVQDFINNGGWDSLYLSWHICNYPGDSDDLNDVEEAWRSERAYNICRAVPTYVNICGLHSILLNRRMLERLSKVEVGPMDTYLNQNLKRFKLFYVAPKIIGPLPSFSAAEGRWQERKVLV